MSCRETQEIATVKSVAFDEGADFRIDQGPQRFERVEYKAVSVGFVAMKEAYSEHGAGCGEIRAEAPGLFCIGKIEHGVNGVGCMARTGCSNAACSVAEWTRNPYRKDATGSRHELQPLPISPTQRASYSLLFHHFIDCLGAVEPPLKFSNLSFRHTGSRKIMPKFLADDFTGYWRGADAALCTNKRGVLSWAWRNKGYEVAKPAGCKDSDMMIDTEAGCLKGERAAPAGEYDGFRFAVVRAGIIAGLMASVVNLKRAASDAKGCTVIKNEDVGPVCVLPFQYRSEAAYSSDGFSGATDCH